MSDFVWRIRCAYHFRRRLGTDWALRLCWEMAGAALECELEPRQSPREAVDEELSCWDE